MFEVILNGVGIVVGTSIGYIFRKYISDNISKSIIVVLGLFIIVTGVKDGIKYVNGLEIAIFLVLGTIIGEALKLDKKLNSCGEYLKEKFSRNKNDAGMVKGFVVATLIFCVGSMGILGPIKVALENNPDILYIKTVLDTVMSGILASSYGLGVMFSALMVVIYQGLIYFLGGGLKIITTNPEIITNISSIGGVMLIGLGFNLVAEKEIKITNMLPALFLPIIYAMLLKFI